MQPIKIALCDDQELFIESLNALFASQGDAIQVLWCAMSGEEALEKVLQDAPDVLVLDYFFKGSTIDGTEICRRMLELQPSLGVLILSVSCEIAVIRQALQSGARGYASKDIGKSALIQGIKSVAEGNIFLDQTTLKEVSGFLCAQNNSNKTGLAKAPITPREMEVAPLYVKGKSVKEIAEMLFISEDTVESHIKNIRSKTGAGSRYEVGEWLKKNDLWVD